MGRFWSTRVGVGPCPIAHLSLGCQCHAILENVCICLYNNDISSIFIAIIVLFILIFLCFLLWKIHYILVLFLKSLLNYEFTLVGSIIEKIHQWMYCSDGSICHFKQLTKSPKSQSFRTYLGALCAISLLSVVSGFNSSSSNLSTSRSTMAAARCGDDLAPPSSSSSLLYRSSQKRRQSTRSLATSWSSLLSSNLRLVTLLPVVHCWEWV